MKTLYRMDEVAPPLTSALLRMQGLKWPQWQHVLVEDAVSGVFVQFCNADRGMLFDLPTMQLLRLGIEPSDVAQMLSLEPGAYSVLQKLVGAGQEGCEQAAADAVLLFDRVFGALGVAKDKRPSMVLALTEESSAPRKETEQPSDG
jgi:hypothetical protein